LILALFHSVFATSCTYAGVTGVCSLQSSCNGQWTASSAGASGCGALADNIRCCTPVSSGTHCHYNGVSGTCQSRAQCGSGVFTASSAGATGCEALPNGVDCCTHPSAPAPSPPHNNPPPPTPGGHPCSYSGKPGTCTTQGQCNKLWTSSAHGATGCQALAANIECCTDHPTTTGLSARAVLDRAYEWVAAKLPYCQSPNGVRDGDASCARVCTRQHNAQWDPYRSDCSGFVSWAWGLPPPGRTTYGFAPAQSDVTHVIQATDLAPGDAVNLWSEHIMLFVRWVSHPHTAVFYEEPGCSSRTPYAHEVTTSVSISGSSIHVSWNGMTFQAIRFNAISGQSAALLVDEPSAPDDLSSGTSSSAGGSNVGVIVGAVLGAIAFVVLVIVVVIGVCVLRRRGSENDNDSMVYANPSFTNATPMATHEPMNSAQFI